MTRPGTTEKTTEDGCVNDYFSRCRSVEQRRRQYSYRKQYDEFAFPGKHYFSGTPRAGHDTFSVGVFECLATKRGDDIKKGKVRVRVHGLTADPVKAYMKASDIAEWLDAGTYTGAKSVSVKSK